MLAGNYPVSTSKNAKFTERWSIAGISDATGYTASVQVRTGEDDGTDSTLLLGLTHASGLTLSSSGGSLHVDVLMTEAQIDAIYDACKTAGLDNAYYSLKVTPPAAGADQWLVGTFTVVATPTA